jgi:hypothetical protein
MSVLISRYLFKEQSIIVVILNLWTALDNENPLRHVHTSLNVLSGLSTDLTGWICSLGLGLPKNKTHFQHFLNIPIIRSCKTLLHSWWRQTASPSYHPDWIPHFRSKTRCFMCWGLRPVQPLVLGIRWYTGYTQFVVQTNRSMNSQMT